MSRFPVATALALSLTMLGCAPEGPTAYVTHNVPPDDECIYSPTGDLFLGQGRYDISPGANIESTECEHPYFLHLVVKSNLRTNADIPLGRAEPNVLQIHSAEVKLTAIDKRLIGFDRFAEALPNPFLVTANNTLEPTKTTDPTSGIVTVEAIPAAYAQQLDRFIDGQILAEIQLFGTTLGDVDVDFKPFVYPVEICDGCLTRCRTDLELLGTDLENLVSCTPGADGQLCVDSTCGLPAL